MIKTKKQIEELAKLDSRTRRTCGNGLLIVRDPRSSKRGLYFCGTMQRRIPGHAKPVTKECWIGVYGDKAGQLTLSSAHQAWEEIKSWAIENDKDPADFKRTLNRKVEEKKTLKHAIDLFLEIKQPWIKETTLREYNLKLNNQVLREIPASTTLDALEWNNGGRAIVMEAIRRIADGSKYDLARRCQKLLFQVFNCAISHGWMQKGQNPAERLLGDDSPNTTERHHRSIAWEEVPSLIESIELNRCSMHIQTVMATKLMLMTFLRAGALVRLEWDWIDGDIIRIPGTVPGLKRRKGKHDSVPHLVPVTPQIHLLLEKVRKINGGESKYVFTSTRKSRYPHLDPSSPNQFLKNIGFGESLVAHGWRRVAKTNGIDLLKVEQDVIDRQLGHLPKGKVNQAYDGSLRMEERREFLRKWCSLLADIGLSI